MKIYTKATFIVAHRDDLGQTPQLNISPCPNCGSLECRTGAGKKPGEASLHCSGCKQFIAWIGSSELKALLKGGAQ